MAALCLSRTATSFRVSSWKSLSLMMTGVSWLSSRKTYLRLEGRGLSSIEDYDGTSVSSTSMDFASSSSSSMNFSTSRAGSAMFSR